MKEFNTTNQYNDTVKAQIELILGIYASLQEKKDLDPSPEVNTLFEKLVSIVLSTGTEDSEKILLHPGIISVQKALIALCSLGEYLLEKDTAYKVIKSDNPKETLENFRYYSNYQKLTAIELEQIQKNSVNQLKKVLFVGSGPLPLSAIIMANDARITIDCVDISKEACSLSKELISKLGLSERITIIHRDILDMQDFSSYDAIILGALVGEDIETKNDIISHLSTRIIDTTLLLLRSVCNLGKLLYQEIPEKSLKILDVVAFIPNTDDIINPVIVARKKKPNHIFEAQEKTKILLSQYASYKSLSELLRKAEQENSKTVVETLKRDLQTISDDMKFDNPLIWIMYKHEAYKDSSKAIITIGDLRAHINHPGDICYKRFHFLNEHLKKEGKDLYDMSIFPDTTEVTYLYTLPILTKLLSDSPFVEDWTRYEYYEEGGVTTKWENYLI